jgi:Ca2+:H+ antiporter
MKNPVWTLVAPVLGWLVLGGTMLGWDGGYLFAVVGGLVACVFAGVFHAEVVAHRVGEPFGTLVLAIVITVIEVALIVTLIRAGGPEATAIARTPCSADITEWHRRVPLVALATAAEFHLQDRRRAHYAAAIARPDDLPNYLKPPRPTTAPRSTRSWRS